MRNDLSWLSDRDLDGRIHAAAAVLNSESANLERLLDERATRGDDRQIALTPTAISWIAAGSTPIAGVTA